MPDITLTLTYDEAVTLLHLLQRLSSHAKPHPNLLMIADILADEVEEYESEHSPIEDPDMSGSTEGDR